MSERVTVRNEWVSLAGLIGRPSSTRPMTRSGRLVDIVARPGSDGERYPPATGLIVRVGRCRLWVPAGQLSAVAHGEVRLATARLNLREYARRAGEVCLGRDLLDHQLVDVDGRRLIRAADLVLAPLRDELRLVGVDVSMVSLVRRIGPARLRVRPTPDRVIDWAAIQSLGERSGDPVRLCAGDEALRTLRPAELADLLAQRGCLGRVSG